VVLVAPRPAVAESLIDLLWKQGFPAADLRRLATGEAIARTLRTDLVGPNGTAEILAMGAIRVEFPREALVEGVRNVAAWRKDGVVSLHTIGLDPKPADFAGVSLPARDLEDLRSCEPGRMPAEAPRVPDRGLARADRLARPGQRRSGESASAREPAGARGWLRQGG
jgi:hypothetical protein